MNENTNFKPTLKKPINKQSKGLEDNFKKNMSGLNIKLNEIDSLLTEKEQSLKKKIFSLPKMEALVFSDPKLSAIYDEMAENGEEKYGYHYNETIQNMIFNDYVLNSPKYILKYKRAIPKKKKRRDKSGINQIKKAGEETMRNKGLINGKKDNDVSETTSCGSAGGSVGYVGYATPSAWGNGDLMKGKKSKIIRKPIWSGGKIIQENENLINDNEMIETSEQLQALLKTRKLTKNDIPKLKGQALYDVALKFANKMIGYVDWDDLGDTNSLWDYIDENGGMTYNDLINSVKDAVDDRLRADRFDGIFYEAKRNIKTKIGESEYLTDSSGFEKYVNELESEKFYGERIKIYVNDIPYYLERVDYTHFFMSKEETKRGILYKIEQHRGQPYYFDVQDWLFGGDNKPDGKKYYTKQNEDATSMVNASKLQSREDSMSNKMETSSVPTGTQQSGGLNESEFIEQVNKELEAISKYHNILSNMNEDRKISTEVDRQRIINQNPSNFKKDLNYSGTKKIIDVQKELEWKDQQITIKDPQKLGVDIEKQEIKSTNANSNTHLKNVGNSDNDKGNEIPKRNRTQEEQNEVDLYTKGLHSVKFDIEPSKRFKDRMKKDMGDKFYEIRKKQLEDGKKQPLYNKESQPVYDGNEMNQYNKYKDINESMITGRYVDILGKKRIIDFNIHEVLTTENVNGLFKLDLTGFGNKYNSKTVDYKIIKNDKIINLMENYKFYTDGKNSIFKIKKEKNVVNENLNVDNKNLNKMKHLLNYKPKNFIDTKSTKKNRGF